VNASVVFEFNRQVGRIGHKINPINL